MSTPKDVQATIAAAAAALGGSDTAVKTLSAMYHLGRMDGLLEMAQVDHQLMETATCACSNPLASEKEQRDGLCNECL